MKRIWAVVAAVGLMALSGCSDGVEKSEGTPSPKATPTLAEPVELDYYATVLADNGSDLALVGDWMDQKLRVIDAEGDEQWSINAAAGEDDSGGTEAYSAGETVIVHDYSGTTSAYSWADGREMWSFDIPGTDSSCLPPRSFASQSTGSGGHLGEGDLLLLEHTWMGDDGGCESSAETSDAVVYALDPATGEEAWPAMSIGADGRTFGGRLVELAPDRKSGIMSWMDGDESMITRIFFGSGGHISVPITEAREIDDSGADYFTVFPTADPNTLTYVYGSSDPDDPMTSSMTRAAKLSISAGWEESDSATLTADEQTAEATMEDTFDPVCGAELTFSAAGNPACLQVQLFASTVKYQGSDGAVDGWFADAPEAAVDSIGHLGGPQWEPVDVGDKTLVIVPAPKGGIAALDAATGKAAWTAKGPQLHDAGSEGQWGGQGTLPDLELIVISDNKKLTFFEAKTGKPVSEHSVRDYADLTSSQRFVIAGGSEKSTMWAVVDA